MAGKPKLRTFKARLLALGGDPWLWEEIQSGSRMAEIASRLETSLGTLYTYLNADPERHTAFQVARKLSAHAMVEESFAILDATEGETQPAAVRSAEIRANHRRWVAERANRPDYGQPEANINIQVNLANVHLTSLKSPTLPTLPLSLPLASTVE